MGVKIAFLLLTLTSFAASSKVDSVLRRSLELNGRENVLVSFSAGIQSALASVNAQKIIDRVQRSSSVYKALLSNSQVSQREAISVLAARRVPLESYKSYWITNSIFIKNADKQVIDALEELASISSIKIAPTGQLKRPIIEEEAQPLKRQNGVLAEWNMEHMGVPLVWEMGINGSGVVVGITDTGVRGTHELIRDQYKNDGRSWRDPYNQYNVPTDKHNHGTHTTGSVVGNNGMGSAPGAQWIACKGYQDDGGATMEAFTECGEFMVCPTDEQGNNADCTKTVHVTSNSWGVWPGTDYFEDILQVHHSVGIIPLFSNGNKGPTCGDMLSPADSAFAIGVGATGSSDELASWSSRGPSRYGVMKPDISAPGMSIRSADCNGDTLYATMSGTSMSCPNASGVAVLMVSKDKNITYERLKNILEYTAVQSVVTSGASCGGVPDTQWPNNHFGFGRINAYAAVMAV